MTAGQKNPYDKTIELLYRQRTWLVLLANSYIQNTETAEDIVNDSFISLLENLDKLDNSVMKAYLATTVKNKCLNMVTRPNIESSSISIDNITASAWETLASLDFTAAVRGVKTRIGVADLTGNGTTIYIPEDNLRCNEALYLGIMVGIGLSF